MLLLRLSTLASTLLALSASLGSLGAAATSVVSHSDAAVAIEPRADGTSSVWFYEVSAFEDQQLKQLLTPEDGKCNMLLSVLDQEHGVSS